jgi:hypothetical protein
MYVAKKYELSNGLNALKDIYAHRIRLLNKMIKAEEKKERHIANAELAELIEAGKIIP